MKKQSNRTESQHCNELLCASDISQTSLFSRLTSPFSPPLPPLLPLVSLPFLLRLQLASHPTHHSLDFGILFVHLIDPQEVVAEVKGFKTLLLSQEGDQCASCPLQPLSTPLPADMWVHLVWCVRTSTCVCVCTSNSTLRKLMLSLLTTGPTHYQAPKPTTRHQNPTTRHQKDDQTEVNKWNCVVQLYGQTQQ